MKTLVEKNLEKMVVLTAEKQAQIDKVKSNPYRSIGRTMIKISEQEIEAEVEKVTEEFNNIIIKLESEIIESIKAAEKKAYQEYYAAELQPTSEQIREAEQLVKEFNLKKGLNGEKEAEFINQMNFHIENETTKAMSYLTAHKELFPTDPNFESYMLKINPKLIEKKLVIESVKVDSNKYDLYKVNEQALTKGAYLTPVERIALMNKAFDLGGNGNLIEFKKA